MRLHSYSEHYLITLSTGLSRIVYIRRRLRLQNPSHKVPNFTWVCFHTHHLLILPWYIFINFTFCPMSISKGDRNIVFMNKKYFHVYFDLVFCLLFAWFFFPHVFSPWNLSDIREIIKWYSQKNDISLPMWFFFKILLYFKKG